MNFFWLATASLIIRLGFARFTAFGLDEAYLADRFADPSVWPTSGGIVAYDGSLRLGTMLTWLCGVPIKLAGGSPLGGMLALSLYGFIEAVVVAKIYEEIFRDHDRKNLWALILFAPWTIVFQSLFHASFSPLFGLLFMVGVLRLMRKPNDFWGWALVPFSWLGCFQIGLYFVPLMVVLGLCFWGRILEFKPNLRGALVGAAVALIPLFSGKFMASELSGYPFLREHPSYGATSTSPHPYVLKEIIALEQGPSVVRQSLVTFEISKLLNLPAHAITVLLRFLTFPTGETLRFTGPGLGANIELLNQHPWLWVFAPISLGFSVFLVLLGLRFYTNHGLPLKVSQSLFRRKSPTGFHEKMDLLVWILPFVFASSFVLSVKGPSAHTFWILWPFAFYPVLRMWSARARFFWVYAASALVFSLGGAIQNSRQLSWHRANQDTHGFHKTGEDSIWGVVSRGRWLRNQRGLSQPPSSK
jgi:hypothetical protein